MKTYTIRKVTDENEKRAVAEELLANLRDIDRREMEGMGISPRMGVETSICDKEPVYVARGVDGTLVCCWGRHKMKGACIIWALGTDEINHYKKTFALESRAIIKQWLDECGMLTNTVATFNLLAIKWLTWMGAEFLQPRRYRDTEYVDFIIRKRRVD